MSAAPEPASGFWRGKRTLVTGATGVVGSWLVRALLDAGADVVALVRDHDNRSELFRSGAMARVAIVSGRVEEPETAARAIDEHEPDTVFHLAAQPIVGVALAAPWPTFEVNVRGSYNVFDACRRRADVVKRVAFASSDKAYGDHGTSTYDEESPLRAAAPYDVSKACGDLIARGYAQTYGTPIAIARCGNIYGGGDLNWSRLVPSTIRSLHFGERPILRSDGRAVRDYIYVRDAVDAYLQLAERAGAPGVIGHAFNFSASSPLAVGTMVARIATAMGRADLSPIVEDTARAEIQHQQLDARRARDVLGWQASYDVERGLAETIAWYRRFFGEAA